MDAFPLSSAVAKARRAEAHLMGLRSVIDSWLEGQPFALAIKDARPSIREDEALFEIDVEVAQLVSTPIEIGVILGDVLTNLRAALDHVAWQLAARDQGTEPTGSVARSVAFPIVDTPDSFAKCQETKLLSPRSTQFVESNQPYPGRGRALSIIRDFSNVDKHRHVHSALAVLKPEPGPTIALDRGVVVDVRVPRKGALRHGDTFLTVVVKTDGPAPTLVEISEVPVQVVFGDNEDVSFADISEARSVVNAIVGRASTELAATLP
jgi:hypothetical protein